MMWYNFFNQLPINDAAENWQCLFQDSGTPTMEGIVNFHHDLTYILIVICVMVVWLLSRALYFFNRKNNIKPAKFIFVPQPELDLWARIIMGIATSFLFMIDAIVFASKGEGCLQEIADSLDIVEGVPESKNVSLNSPLAKLTLEEKGLIKINGNETTPIGAPQSDSNMPTVSRTGPSGSLKRSLVDSFGTNSASQPKR